VAELWLPITGTTVSLIGKVVVSGLVALSVSITSAPDVAQVYLPERAITASSTRLGTEDKLSIVPTFVANIEDVGNTSDSGLVALSVSITSAPDVAQVYLPERAITASSTRLGTEDKLSIVPTFVANIEDVGNTSDSGLVALSVSSAKATIFEVVNEKTITAAAIDASYKAATIIMSDSGGKGYWRYDFLLSVRRCMAIGYCQAPRVLVADYTPQEPGKFHYDTLLSAGHCLVLTKINNVSINLVGVNKKLVVLSVNSFWAAGIVPTPWVGEAIYLF
jgi:hypothetical protein